MKSEEFLNRYLKSRVGEFAEIYGEFHSHNLREENHTRLELYVFAREVKFVEVNDSKTDYTNRILLEGTICKPTVYRKTPLKKEITDLLLAVNRSFVGGVPPAMRLILRWEPV